MATSMAHIADLAMDTLAFQLTLPTTKHVVDFHHLAIVHGGCASKKAFPLQREASKERLLYINS